MRLKPEHITELRKREDLAPQKRREIEFKIRKRLKEFLEFIGDANDIIDYLPHPQLRKSTKLKEVLTPYMLYEAFELVSNLLDLMDYGIVSGPIEKPYVVIYHKNKPEIVRPATDKDINHNLAVQDFVSRLSYYYNSNIKEYNDHQLKQLWDKAEKEKRRKKDKGKAKKEPK